MILVSNCPPRPTNGIPVRSSSAPGASPRKQRRVLGLPTPNTVCVRVLASSLQRVQAATSCCRISNVAAVDALGEAFVEVSNRFVELVGCQADFLGIGG